MAWSRMRGLGNDTVLCVQVEHGYKSHKLGFETWLFNILVQWPYLDSLNFSYTMGDMGIKKYHIIVGIKYDS